MRAGRPTPDRVRAAFREHTGRAAEGVWSAPGRVNLIGEHTDYNAGLALPIALPQRTYAAAARREDARLRVWSAQIAEPVDVDLADIGPGHPANWSAYAVGVPWALARDLAVDGCGLDLVIDSEVPVGAGLSSSAALGCAVGAAVADLWGLGLLDSQDGRRVLVEAAREAENVVAGAPTGGMDQSASMLCRERHALLLDCRNGSNRHVSFDPSAAGLALVVIDTRAPHALVDGQYAKRRLSCERSAAALGVPSLREAVGDDVEATLSRVTDPTDRARARHVITEIHRVTEAVQALDAGRIEALGSLFSASHASLRDDYAVSCPELDVAVAECERHGALGARMTGGGFGGSAITLLPTTEVGRASAAVTTAYARRGWPTPHLFTVTASAGARRET